MQQSDIEAIAAQLADNRSHGRQTDMSLEQVGIREDAEAIQKAALRAYDRDFKGYAMVGTSEVCRRSLGLTEPVFTEIPISDCLRNATGFRLPQGVIGVQCEIALMVGVLNEHHDHDAERESLANGMLACMPTIGILGRRAHIGGDPQLSAIADFGLHVATISGKALSNFELKKLDRVKIVARLDGKAAISFTGASTGLCPFDTVLWLKHELERRGSYINATDIVTTGVIRADPSGAAWAASFGGMG